MPYPACRCPFKLSLPVSSVFVYPFCRLYVLAAEISLDESDTIPQLEDRFLNNEALPCLVAFNDALHDTCHVMHIMLSILV
jgi:hypothetical protein